MESSVLTCRDANFSLRNEIEKQHGKCLNAVNWGWHQLQHKKIFPVKLYSTEYRVSIWILALANSKKNRFFMKQQYQGKKSRIEQLNLKTRVVAFVNEVKDVLSWLKMNFCCWEMNQNNAMAYASNWIVNTPWGTKFCGELWENRCYCKCEIKYRVL